MDRIDEIATLEQEACQMRARMDRLEAENKQIEAERDEWIACHSRIYKQRDELLDALVGMVEAHLLEDYSNSGHYLDLCSNAWMKARDVIHEVDPDYSIREAIARVKGGAE